MAETIQTKYCPQCKQFKPLSEFHKKQSNKDGFQTYCKPCRKILAQSETNRAYQKIYQQHYRQTEKGKVAYSKGNKKYRQTEKFKAKEKRYRVRYPGKVKAVKAINNAIKGGKLPRPDTLLCHYCPKPAQEYHHWHGYELEHYLDVVPVCIKCHNKFP